MEAETFTKIQEDISNDALNIADQVMDDNNGNKTKERNEGELENIDETQIKIGGTPSQGNDSHEVLETTNAQTSQSAEDIPEVMQSQENENREDPKNKMELDATEGSVEKNMGDEHLHVQEVCTVNRQQENESKTMMEDADDNMKTEE